MDQVSAIDYSLSTEAIRIAVVDLLELGNLKEGPCLGCHLGLLVARIQPFEKFWEFGTRGGLFCFTVGLN